MTPLDFWKKWHAVTQGERAVSQQHFLDVCRLVGEKPPQEADPKGTSFCFEKGAEKVDGSNGWADVWRKRCFAWEYKGPHKDLKAAYDQLLQYRESLENPPLLVVCNLTDFEVHTNFTNTAKKVYRFTVGDLRDNPEEPLRILRALFRAPDALKPSISREELTERAAGDFAELAGRLQGRGHDPLDTARFLNRLLFCFFAEDAEVLPQGLLKRLLRSVRETPGDAELQLSHLFRLMAKNGEDRYFGTERIDWFNGGLFADDSVLPLKHQDIELLLDVAEKDWSNIEPAILGTLFERGLDPAKRSQLGAHYTALQDIQRVIEPVVLQPLRREFEKLKQDLRALRTKEKGRAGGARTKAQKEGTALYRAFQTRLRNLRVLDPACGSGNFLYVVLKELKSLEKEAILWAAEELNVPIELPQVGPEVVHGIELNPYAAELARVTVWIGELQWMIANGFSYSTNPILRPLETIECRDAILDRTPNGDPVPAKWPDAEFIIGNPPFLGGKLMRTKLGDDYVEALHQGWAGRVPAEADLVAYWHEKARGAIAAKRARRAGLLATQSIRHGANQQVLEAIKKTGDIFMAWSDQPWVVEGADVRVSIVAQDDGSETVRTLDGQPVEVILADLKGGAAGMADVTLARPLAENQGISFMGDTKGGKFEITADVARRLLSQPQNVNGRPNSDVIRPWVNGIAVTRRSKDLYIIDFGDAMSEPEAAKYEAPFEHLRQTMKKKREASKSTTGKWWIHERPRSKMRRAIEPLRRFIVTVRVAEHRTFVFLQAPTLPDSRLFVFAREDDFFFGMLHSRLHLVWALAKSSRHGKGNQPTYNNTTCFETFPFPWPLNIPEDRLSSAQRKHRETIAAAARSLDEARSAWLNPPDLAKGSEPLAKGFPAPKVPISPAAEKILKARTLTNLYNERPSWLDNAHKSIDTAVFAAYGWKPDMGDEAILAGLLTLNLERPALMGAVVDEDVAEDEEEESDE
ncbi:DNA methyltransferase [Archangium sp.]|uniref:class I SAM-dependent DNA methyltransferase n=1 Tax=Archangium sp. TaxID=1872627 RepID=UPI00286B132B|nr:DNA methyltransferase [Archangium sp.]